MAFTKIVSPGIDTTGSYTVQELNTVGVATAGTVQVGSATTIHTTGIDLGSGNITSHNINSTGIISATSFVGPVTGNVTSATVATNAQGLTGSPSITVDDITATSGTFSGNVSIGGTLTYEDVTNIDSVGIITAQAGVKVTGGQVVIGGDANNGTAEGLQLNTSGFIQASRGSGVSALWAGYTQGSSTQTSRIDNDGDAHFLGKIGVGTDNPQVKLHITAADPYIRLQDTAAPTGYSQIMGTHQGAIAFSADTSDSVADSHFRFDVDGTERLRITSDGKVRVPDNGKFTAGAGDDLQIWSDNTDQYIRGEQNQLLIRSNNLRLQSYLGENYIHAANNNAVSLYYDNSKKLETTTTGATITSDLILDHASGDKAIRWATGGTNKWSLYHNNGAGALVAYDNANNAERLRINANGTATFNNAVLIGGVTTNNGFKLKVSDGGGYEFAFGPNDSGINSLVSYDRSGSAYVDCRIIQKELQLWSGTGPVERLRITSGGKVLAGNYFTSQQIGYYESSIQIQGTDSHTASMSIFRYSNDNGGSNLTLGKGRGTSGGDVDKPQNGDALGALRWVMANNNNLTDGESAKIECNVDNIPGGGDYPSRLTFWTASDGANSVTERLRITSGGEIKIPGSSGSMLTINEGSPSGNFYQEIAYAPGGKGCLYLENFAYYAGQPALVVNDQDTNNQRVMEDVQFQRNGTLRGYIRINPGSVTYSTSSSDIRTKKNFEDWTEDNLSKFKTLSPKLFNWIEEDDGSEKTKGFIAQDNLEKFPEAYPLTASTDRYAFNPSGMVAYLMKALQEAALKIETLEGRMDDAGL